MGTLLQLLSARTPRRGPEPADAPARIGYAVPGTERSDAISSMEAPRVHRPARRSAATVMAARRGRSNPRCRWSGSSTTLLPKRTRRAGSVGALKKPATSRAGTWRRFRVTSSKRTAGSGRSDPPSGNRDRHKRLSPSVSLQRLPPRRSRSSTRAAPIW